MSEKIRVMYSEEEVNSKIVELGLCISIVRIWISKG